MKDSSLQPPLPPHELARRQRWVYVGVTILTILLVGTWVVGLPSRIQSLVPGFAWNGLFGELPNSENIKLEQVFNTDEQERRFTELLEAYEREKQSTAASSTTSTPAVTPTSTSTAPAAVNTSTVEYMKKKLK